MKDDHGIVNVTFLRDDSLLPPALDVFIVIHFKFTNVFLFILMLERTIEIRISVNFHSTGLISMDGIVFVKRNVDKNMIVLHIFT
jgi:hypothetical protein